MAQLAPAPHCVRPGGPIALRYRKQLQYGGAPLFEGRVRPGDTLLSRSIIGSEFVTEFIAEDLVGPYLALRNRISGQCWIYAMSQIGLDPSDPFPPGFTLSDTWGG